MGTSVSPASDQTQTLTEDGQLPLDSSGAVLTLRWCHPLPAVPPLVLGRERLTIGRDPGCDAQLESGHVSRIHAEIRRSGPTHVISDLESKNGVRINGTRVPQAVLNAGDVVRVGDFVGVVVMAPKGAELAFGQVAEAIHGGHRHRAVAARARELAVSKLPLVLEGATGAGKELMARAVHTWSGRMGPFLAVNSAVYSRTMAAAELFGFKKGAFTGAEQASLGHVRAADNGTLFLDEILELSLEVQGMLLRTLELGEVHPLGETRPVPVDVRFVVASQIPLAEAVAAGKFRPDLRARLEGAVIRLPELAECREIVPELLLELYRRRGGAGELELSPAVVEALCLHAWPLNVRELDMLAGRLAARRSTERLSPAALELSTPLRSSTLPAADELAAAAVSVPGRPSGPYELEEMERLRAALERHRGNVTRAVAELGITRQRAYRMLSLLKPDA